MKIFREIESTWRSANHKLGGHKMRKALHMRGKNFQSLLGAFRPANSAESVSSSYSPDPYGPTGSIVGRY